MNFVGAPVVVAAGVAGGSFMPCHTTNFQMGSIENGFALNEN